VSPVLFFTTEIRSAQRRKEGAMADPMKEYKDYAKSAGGLRKFSQMLLHNNQFGGGYAICVLESAADEVERLTKENARLARELQESKQKDLI
jgi:hypothetical protein